LIANLRQDLWIIWHTARDFVAARRFPLKILTVTVFGLHLPRSRDALGGADQRKMNMAKKQTVLSNRPYIATFFLFVVVLLFACTKGSEAPSVSVPADSQQFLDKYFGAWKSKDIATLQSLCFYLSPEDRARLPEGSLEMWRESKNKLVNENFERVTTEFGDFKGYEVLSVKTTTISPQDQPAANMMGSGIHTQLVCKAKFSKKRDAHVGLHLIKETESSPSIAAAWSFGAAP
jgi:hypothetical protein